VHIGDADLPPQEARALLGAGKIIGYSTHNAKEAKDAEELGARGFIDYISCGPIFPTKTKKDARPVTGIEGLKKIRKKTSLRVVAIGGITEENLTEVIRAGADSVAIISELLLAPNISAKTKSIIATIKKDGSRG
jgi:thiamine-phosphate diphosphorylase